MNEEELKRQEELANKETDRYSREQELKRANMVVQIADDMKHDMESDTNGAIAAVAPDVAALRVASDEEVSRRLNNPGHDTSVPVLDENNNRVATPSAKTQTPTPAPAAPTLENGGTVVKNGMGETMFGKYKRVVDQKSGKETWINTETGQEEVPQSMRFQQMSDTTRRVMDEQRRGAHERRVRSMQRRVDAGNAFGAALSTLTGEVARGEDGSIFGKDGKPIDERIRVSADGKHIYLMGKAEPGVLRDVNDSRRRNGSASDYTAVMAYRELDRNGNPLKNEDGTERSPMIAVTDQPGGDPNAKRRFRIMSSGDVANKMLDAMKSLGRGDEDAKNEIITNVFGGIDPLGWGKTLKQKPNDGKLTFEQRVALEEKKNEGRLAVEEARLVRQLGKQQLDPHEKYALYHFNDFMGARIATEDDVRTGRAKKTGDYIIPTKQEAFNSAVDFYKTNMHLKDPALGGGNGGGSQMHPDNPVLNPPVAPAAGGQAQAQTAAPSLSANAEPPAEGQGELDFGGAEPEAGNLTHEGRKWKLYTDDNGKVSGYGTTRSIVTKTDDGRFAVIPTIVNGEELSEADAVEHFKKTGEHWGIVKTEDDAKKLAEQVHLDGQEHERAAWNEYIQDHWDEMSDEIRNDPGVAEERKRRQAAKPKSNSWKNSALFK